MDFIRESALGCVRREMERYCAQENVDDRSFDCAMVLLAAAEHGADIQNLIAVTAVAPELVQTIDTRMRESALWVETTAHFAHWFEDEHFTLFYEDLCVARGLTRRVIDRSGISYVPS